VIHLFRPDITERECTAVREVLESGWIGAGERVAAFERAFARHIGVDPSELVSLSCCTEGLFQAVAALGIGPGDEVVLPSISFPGAAHAIAATGAVPVFTDVNRHTLNPQPDHVAAALSGRTRAAILLHYGGLAGAVPEIAELLRAQRVALIEDAACAAGTRCGGQACGTFGDIGVWSFDAMKLLAAGDGGMLWARDPALLDRVRRNTRLGLTGGGFAAWRNNARWWDEAPAVPGRRALMNDLTAGIALAQLERIDGFRARRREIARRYRDAFADLAWLRLPPDPAPRERAARYFWWVQCATERARDALARHLRGQEIYASFKYTPLHSTDLYRQDRSLPGAEAAAAQTLILPSHHGMSDTDVAHVIGAVRAFDPPPTR
jgi:aminotransferase